MCVEENNKMENDNFFDDPAHVEEYNEYLDMMELYAQEQEWPEDYKIVDVPGWKD